MTHQTTPPTEIKKTVKHLPNLQMHGLASHKKKEPVSEIFKMAVIKQMHERKIMPKPISLILHEHPIMTPMATSESARNAENADLP